MLSTGQPVQAIEKRLNVAAGAPGLLPGATTAIKGLIAAFRSDVSGACALARRALSELPEGERLLRGFAVWILSAVTLAEAAPMADRAALDDALRAGQRAGNPLISVIVMCSQAELEYR